MKNLKLIAVWILFSSIATQCFCHGQSLSAGDGDDRLEKSLRAEIKLTQTEVRSKEVFKVDTAIYNTGETEQAIVMWSCAFPVQWQTDNAAVKVAPFDCDWNNVSEIKLKPGEGIQKLVFVRIELPDEQISRNEISFRMGFRNADPTKPGFAVVKTPTLWSNSVTVSLLGKP